MKSLSGVGLGLSVVFVCLLLVLLGELYYFFYRKRRFTTTNKDNTNLIGHDDYTSPARDFLYLFCFKKPNSSRQEEVCSSSTNTLVNHEQDQENVARLGQLQVNNNSKDLFFDDSNNNSNNDSCIEAELMSLCGPSSRFLFTIVEETKEDLESEDGILSRGASTNNGFRESIKLSDLLSRVEETTTPYLTPLASPSLFTPPLTPLNHCYSSCSSLTTKNNHNVHNSLFQFAKDAEFNKIRSSPPPKFKFLQDAEATLSKKKTLMQEQNQDRTQGDATSNGFGQDCERKSWSGSKIVKDEKDGSFVTIVVDKKREINTSRHKVNNGQNLLPQQYSHAASTSQVLPLACSPSTTATNMKSKAKINYTLS